MEDFYRPKLDPQRLPESVRIKWGESVLGEGFVPFPKMLFRFSKAIFGGKHPLDELAVVLALADYKRPTVGAPPSKAMLAFIAGIEESEFSAALAALEERGLATVQPQDGRVNIDLSGLYAKVQELASSGES